MYVQINDCCEKKIVYLYVYYKIIIKIYSMKLKMRSEKKRDSHQRKMSALRIEMRRKNELFLRRTEKK